MATLMALTEGIKRLKSLINTLAQPLAIPPSSNE